MKDLFAKNEAIVKKAYMFAEKKHRNQKDDNGFPYFTAHVCQVARIIDTICSEDAILIQSAFLHDLIEDTNTTYDEIKNKFGYEVADLVMEVTHEGDKTKGYYFPRLHTQRGIILKLADRHQRGKIKGSGDNR